MLPTGEEKIEILHEYARRYPEIRTFIETGTSDGTTTAAMVPYFDRLYTIELGHDVYLHNVKRFLTVPKVLPLWGDSATVLRELLYAHNGPALFWLDAHFCGGARAEVDTPIEAELREVFRRPAPGVVLIDDSRLFGVDPAYPTIEWVENVAKHHSQAWDFLLKDDIMRMTPA